MTEVEKIARGLTEEARLLIFRCGIAYGNRFYAANVMRPFVRRGIFNRRDTKGFTTTYSLTPLGLALRQYLQEQSQ